MARPPLPIGSWGRISSRVLETDENGKPTKVRAKANFRDHDGHVRDVTAYGKTATAAERALLKKLQDRAKTSQAGELTAMHKITHLLDLWEQKFAEMVADGQRPPPRLTPTGAPSRTTCDPPSARSASARQTRLASTK